MEKKLKNKTVYTVLLAVCVIGFWIFENFYTPAPYSDGKEPNRGTTVPDFALPSSTTGAIVAHNYFTLSYSEKHEQAEWVAYTLKRDQLTKDDRKRPYFIEDPKVRTKSADWRNYKGSGYDRGHLCPAGDRRFSEQAYNETFYTSNIVPQDADFNAGIWNRLELQVRQWSRKYGTLFVVTGGVLENGLEVIGEEDVAVPKYFYKIVAKGDPENLEVIAFLMPGTESAAPLQQMAVSVDEIERMTGIDFFEKLPGPQQERIEGKIDMEGWGF